MHEHGEISSISDALGILDFGEMRDLCDSRNERPGSFPYGLWFRGQPSDENMPLLPPIFRPSVGGDSPSETASVEKVLIEQFQLRQPSIRLECQSLFDWLVVMQHHGLPTRLLDWTENILVALFFAVNSRQHSQSPARLYVLGALSLAHEASADFCSPDIFTPTSYEAEIRTYMSQRQITSMLLRTPELERHEEFQALKRSVARLRDDEDIERFRKLGYPAPVFPVRNTTRAQVQASVFTIHGGYPRSTSGSVDGLGQAAFLPHPVAIEKLDKADEGRLIRVYGIPADAKPRLKRELRLVGMHLGYLFPEPEHQAAYLKEAWLSG